MRKESLPRIPESMASPTGFEPVSSDRKSDVLDQTRRWGHIAKTLKSAKTQKNFSVFAGFSDFATSKVINHFSDS